MSLSLSCGEASATAQDSDTETTATTYTATPDSSAWPLVSLQSVEAGRLPLRKQLNGKIRARQQILIKAQSSGLLRLAPEEGANYRMGDTLLQVDQEALLLARQRAWVARDEAAFRQKDLLIQMSAAYSDSSLTDVQRENVRVRSGLPAAEAALAEAEFLLSQSTLLAPFSGQVADLKVQAFQSVAMGEEVCTLIDLNSLEVEFRLLESELTSLRENDRVFVSLLTDDNVRIPARLDIINPLVEDGGLVRARAKLELGRSRPALFPGMNVRVTMERATPSAILVPKQAVVERGGRPLVFVYKPEEGFVAWTYVTILAENDELMAIGEELSAGDLVVVAGNLHLDHQSRVRIENEE
ncbi:MAG: efflux RND transporter periplasmic adaptor subunit [Bacteroidota bacterium]